MTIFNESTMKIIVVFVVSLVLVDVVNGMTKKDLCNTNHHPNSLHCRCKHNEKEIDVGELEGQKNVTTLKIEYCDRAIIPADLGQGLLRLTSIEVKDITESLDLSAQIESLHLKIIEFLNIGEIISIINPFPYLTKLEHFKIENAVVGSFEQNFDLVEVKDFILKNVVIKDLQKLEFDTNGRHLEITDCHIIVSKSPLILKKFQQIKIFNTTFEFTDGNGSISMLGHHIHLHNNKFQDAMISVTGDHISVTNTCADGSSSMRLNSTNSKITSNGNELPTEIVYVPAHKNENNVICKGAKCNCHMACIGPKCRQPNNANVIHGATTHCLLFTSSVISWAGLARI